MGDGKGQRCAAQQNGRRFRMLEASVARGLPQKKEGFARSTQRHKRPSGAAVEKQRRGLV